jgi:hypothetical protein
LGTEINTRLIKLVILEIIPDIAVFIDVMKIVVTLKQAMMFEDPIIAFAAAIPQPYISERNYWVLKHHGLFQGYYYFHHINKDRNIRDNFKDHQFYQACVDFCSQWDQCSFDPDYDTLPLEHFEPMVGRVISEPWNHLD